MGDAAAHYKKTQLIERYLAVGVRYVHISASRAHPGVSQTRARVPFLRGNETKEKKGYEEVENGMYRATRNRWTANVVLNKILPHVS
jgi:hypothetical protein